MTTQVTTPATVSDPIHIVEGSEGVCCLFHDRSIAAYHPASATTDEYYDGPNTAAFTPEEAAEIIRLWQSIPAPDTTPDPAPKDVAHSEPLRRQKYWEVEGAIRPLASTDDFAWQAEYYFAVPDGLTEEEFWRQVAEYMELVTPSGYEWQLYHDTRGDEEYVEYHDQSWYVLYDPSAFRAALRARSKTAFDSESE